MARGTHTCTHQATEKPHREKCTTLPYVRKTQKGNDTALLRAVPARRQMSGMLHRNAEGVSNAYCTQWGHVLLTAMTEPTDSQQVAL